MGNAYGISDDVWAMAKIEAAKGGISIREYVEKAIRLMAACANMTKPEDIGRVIQVEQADYREQGRPMPKLKTEEVVSEASGGDSTTVDMAFVNSVVSRRMGHPVGCACVHCGKVRAMLMPKVNK